MVALGLAGMFHEVEGSAVQKLKEVVDHSVERKQSIILGGSTVMAARLHHLGVGVGRPGATKIPRPRQKVHDLTKVRLFLAYDRAHDRISLSPTVQYGPCSFPLETPMGSSVERIQKDGVIHIAGRDQVEEHRIFSDLGMRAGVQRGDVQNFFVQGEDIYWFLKETLAELEFRYEVERDPSLTPLLQGEEAEITSAWTTRAKEGDTWFDFSLQWHCANADVSIDQLKDMVKSQKPFIRKPDGTFVECKNQADVKRLVEF